MGKDFIYTRAFLRCSLVGPVCAINELELDAGECLDLFGKEFICTRVLLMLCVCVILN